MFSGRMDISTDAEDWVLIDRDGKHFGLLLNFLRDGDVDLPDEQRELREILREAQYFCIQVLIQRIEARLAAPSSWGVVLPGNQANVILINRNSQQASEAIIKSGAPVVKFTMNRHNNKYSYTSSSYDLLLRNNETFENLAVRFPSAIKFVKDIWGQSANPENGICTWTFYFNGQTIADEQSEGTDHDHTSIVCHSIFYGNEKKQTKVDFHEPKIYARFIKLLSLLIEGGLYPALSANRGASSVEATLTGGPGAAAGGAGAGANWMDDIANRLQNLPTGPYNFQYPRDSL